MLVSLDGGVTYTEAPEGVRIIHDTAFRVGDDEPVALHINLTNEVMVLDLWSESANVGTECQMFDDIVNEFLDAI